MGVVVTKRQCGLWAGIPAMIAERAGVYDVTLDIEGVILGGEKRKSIRNFPDEKRGSPNSQVESLSLSSKEKIE